MESMKHNHKSIFEKLLFQSFNGLYQYDDVLKNYIVAYQNSSWNKQKVLKDQILHRFIQNKPSEIDPQYFSQMYNNFLEAIDNPWISKKIDVSDLDTKLFREGENKKKLLFILENTDISEDIVIVAQKLSNNNPYHNFGHHLGVAETAIMLAQAAECTRKQINLLALCGLFHDAGHTGIHDPQAEEYAYQLTRENFDDTMRDKLWCTPEQLHTLIIATKLEQRGKVNDILAQIIQDADIGAISRWPHYFLYATMGIVEEEKIDINDYIDKEQAFIDKLKQVNPDIFVSDIGQKILTNPQQSLDTIKKRGHWVIQEAYKIRKNDINFDEFCVHIEKIRQKHS